MTRLLTVGWETGNVNEVLPLTAACTVAQGNVITGHPRTGTQCMSLIPGGVQKRQVYTLGVTATEIWCRVPVYFHSNGAVSATGTVVEFYDGNSATIASITIESLLGILQLRRSNGAGTILATSSLALTYDQWSALEIDYKPHGTTGVFTLYQDGTQVATFSGNTTQGLASCVAVAVCGSTTNLENYFDDIAVNDLNGAQNTGRFADNAGRIGGILGLRPNGDNAVQWTPNSGGTNYTQVDEVPANGDTDYVYDSTVGHQDLYDLQDLPSTAISIAVVNEVVTARNTDASGTQISLVTSSGGTVTTDAAVILSQTYAIKAGVQQEVDPHTTNAWDTAGVNALLAGMVVV